MAFYGKGGVFSVHTRAVVRYANQSLAAVLNFNFDTFRARVNRIFYKLLDDGSRAFNDFARRNFVYRVGVKQFNISHRVLTPFAPDFAIRKA